MKSVEDRLSRATKTHIVGNAPLSARPFLAIAAVAAVFFAGLAVFASHGVQPAPPGYLEDPTALPPHPSQVIPDFGNIKGRLAARRQASTPAPAASSPGVGPAP